MGQSLTREALSDTGCGKHVDGALLEDTGTDAALDIAAVALFQNDAVDTGEMHQPRKQQACGSPSTMPTCVRMASHTSSRDYRAYSAHGP